MARGNNSMSTFDKAWTIWEYVVSHENANLAEFGENARATVGYKHACKMALNAETPLTLTYVVPGNKPNDAEEAAKNTKAQEIISNIALASDAEKRAILHDASPYKAFAEQALNGVKAKTQAEIAQETLGEDNAPKEHTPGSLPALRAEAKKRGIKGASSMNKSELEAALA